MSHVSHIPLRPASSRRLLGPAVALFVVAVVVVLALSATGGQGPVPDGSAQAGACATQYQNPAARPSGTCTAAARPPGGRASADTHGPGAEPCPGV